MYTAQYATVTILYSGVWFHLKKWDFYIGFFFGVHTLSVEARKKICFFFVYLAAFGFEKINPSKSKLVENTPIPYGYTKKRNDRVSWWKPLKNHCVVQIVHFIVYSIHNLFTLYTIHYCKGTIGGSRHRYWEIQSCPLYTVLTSNTTEMVWGIQGSNFSPKVFFDTSRMF